VLDELGIQMDQEFGKLNAHNAPLMSAHANTHKDAASVASPPQAVADLAAVDAELQTRLENLRRI